MKTLFDIGEDKEAGIDHTLLLEIGKGYCSTALFDKSNNTIDRLQVTSFDELEADQHLAAILSPLKKAGVTTVIVGSGYPEAILCPTKYFTSDHSSLELVYDQPAQAYFNDSINEWQMVNLYSLPQDVHQVITDNFSNIQYFHAYTPTIKIYNGFAANNQLLVHFTELQFRVVLKAHMAICLAQTYTYKTPLDVIYYLLKICYEFQLSQEETLLVISGLVEKDSHLFSDLQQYFTQIHFAQQPGIGLPQSGHPHYFFTSIYNLAACVS